MIDKKEILFPHSSIRNIQGDMVNEVIKVIDNKWNLIMHAPTGIGKTAAVLSPAISYALKNDKTVFFLTSRHTQHKLAIDTIKEMKKKHGTSIITTDIIGKKWMCIQEGVQTWYSNEFSEYCKKLKEDKKCEFYANTKKNNKLTPKAKSILDELKTISPSHSEELIGICKKEKLCPHEMAALLAKEAKVIIGDYNYIFDPVIKDTFLLKSGKELKDCIIIVDEGHNLPKRVRDNLTVRLTNVILKRAIKEATKFHFFEERNKIEKILQIIEELSDELDDKEQEKLISKDKFISLLEEEYDYDDLITSLAFAGDEIREKQRQSYVGSVAFFLEMWPEEPEGIVRIISKKPGTHEMIIEISSRSLDPSVVTKEVIDEAHSVILMSGTLTPTFMYKDILGFKDAVEKEFESPFPKENRLNLIIPDTTTKFTRRNKDEFVKISDILEKISKSVKGNILVFFPSYYLRNQICHIFSSKLDKKIFYENQGLTKEDKNQLLEDFKAEKDNGALLMAVASGSFGEGVDLPGDYLKCVVVVGLPLERPSLEIKELISYYDKKFSRGWDYGYVYPAIIKVLQNAGRCIRSETDKGVIVFLDERFAWENYYKCFPKEYDVKISKLYEEKIKKFFS